MAGESVLRIARSDSPGDFVLVKVSSKSRSSELDLRFSATEGESPYTGSLKSSQINKLRHKNYRGSDDEWAGILAYALGQKKAADIEEDWKSGLEIAAAVKPSGEDDDEDKELVITLRKRIDTITQRLGAITLKQNDDELIQPFDWAGIAVSRANELEEEVSSLAAKYRGVEDTIAKLNAQLEDFIQAKNEHDKELMAKFALLLNEKKLKIRNQQRILATAKIDSGKAAELESSLESKKPRKPAPSRPTKRKAQNEVVKSEDESEDGFDAMDIDTANNKNNQNAAEPEEEEDVATESDRQSTPEPLEDETATEGDEDEFAEPPPQPARAEESSQKGSQKGAAASSQRSTRKETASPPPRRDLPFARRKGGAKAAPAQEEKKAANDDSGKESDDDEL